MQVVNSSGQSLAINRYDEYGNPDAGNVGRFQYTGQIRLPEVKLYYYKARMYSSEDGRFLQTDPVGYDDQLNLYAYVANDPVNKEDPSGNQEATAAGAALGCAVTAEVGCAPGAVGGAIIGGVIDLAGAASAACIASSTCRGWVGSILHSDSKAQGSSPAPGKPTLNPDKQGKHVPGHKNFQPGRGEVTHPDPQGLLNGHAGTGQQVGDTPVGEAGSKERVDFGQPVGIHVDGGTGARSNTTRGIIHYGKDDAHIVPSKPLDNQ